MNDELTTRLSRQLHDQVDDWQTTPLSLDDVRGRARSIRRTRRVVAGAAVAAVVAVAVPLGLLAGGVLDASPDRELPPATDTPSEGVEQDPSGLGIPYVTGRTLTMPDGTETELPQAYDTVTVLGDRVLGVFIDADSGRPTLDRIEGGEVVDSDTVPELSLVPNAEVTAVAYTRAGSELVVETADGPTSLGEQPRLRPIVLVGDCGQDSACTLYLDAGVGAPRVLDSEGVGAVPGDPIAVADATPEGRVAMMTSIDELAPSSCSRVVEDGGEGATVFETCEVSLVRFSPDAGHLSATDAYRSGIGPSQAVIVDGTTGEQVARFAPESGYVHSMVWEDSEHLLALVHDFDDRSWSVLRLGVDGEVETALGPTPGNEMRPPFRLVGPS